MATASRFARALACPNRLGRLPSARPVVAAASSLPLQLAPAALSITQVRYARTMTKAELEDLQGIPVRLLRDIVGFGRKRTCCCCSNCGAKCPSRLLSALQSIRAVVPPGDWSRRDQVSCCGR
jgi:hypothetical protein